MPEIRHTFAAALRNPMSQLGAALALVSGVLFVILFLLDLLGFQTNPYVGIMTFVLMPTVFTLGLGLTIWGILRERKRAGDGRFPVIDFNIERTRRRLVSFVVIVCTCVVLLATATSGGIHYMESNAFCGTVCHTVMSPEYTAFQDSPHAEIACVDCHVSPGAGGFIRAKVNGAWQLVAATTGIYSRPIPTPVHNLPPNDQTCEQCHWPGKYHGVIPKMITRFAEDEANTETRTVLLMNVGGNDSGESLGIHWHTDPHVQIRYRADEKRLHIHAVELTRRDGTVKTYRSRTHGDEADDGAWHEMQCVDCHNRPAHVYRPAVAAVDSALERGFIDHDLPYIRREAVRVIQGDYPSHDQARHDIAAAIASFYETSYPAVYAERRADVERAGGVLGDIYARNVFPSMKIEWGTYPSFAGHTNGSTGCFRCHAGDHATADGEVITVDCRACHTIVAWDEASPEIIEMLRGRRKP